MCGDRPVRSLARPELSASSIELRPRFEPMRKWPLGRRFRAAKPPHRSGRCLGNADSWYTEVAFSVAYILPHGSAWVSCPSPPAIALCYRCQLNMGLSPMMWKRGMHFQRAVLPGSHNLTLLLTSIRIKARHPCPANHVLILASQSIEPSSNIRKALLDVERMGDG
jgi:hypothetical protein